MIVVLFIVYQFVQLIFLPIGVAYLVWRAVQKKPVFGNVWQRMGFVPRTTAKRTVWVHAVSVGEVLASARLIDEIKIKNSETAVYVTTGTLGGCKVAREQLNADIVSFIPFDFAIPMMIAFMRIKPVALIVIEGDFWPNLLIFARWFKIPTYAINARVTKRSQKTMYRFRWFYRHLLESFTALMTQTEDDVEAFKKLGVDKQRLQCLGNIKSYNVVAKKEALAQRLNIDQQMRQKGDSLILLVGSVHPAELDVYLELFKACKNENSLIKMILVPRHFHWKTDLQRKVAAAGYSSFMWDETTEKLQNPQTMLNDIEQEVFLDHDIVLVCTLGRLFALYPLADIFYLGGTFVPIGGHNLLEPAVWGIPSFVGPHYQNTKDSADQLEHIGAVIKVTTVDQLIVRTRELLEHPEVRQAAATSARQWLTAQASQVEREVQRLVNTF